MALHIRDEETERLVRNLASLRKLGLTEAVRVAVEGELKRIPLGDRIRPIQERVAAAGRSGFVADKTFFDALCGE
jgi:antitoxin VapB